MILNCLCVCLQIMLLRKDIRFVHLLQIPLSIIIGYVINFVYYDILVFDLSNYYLRVIIIVFYILSAFIVAGILIIDEITYSLEGLCSTITPQMHLSFAKMRQMADVLCVIISLCISIFGRFPFSMREETIIGVFIFGLLIDFAIEKEKEWLFKYIG